MNNHKRILVTGSRGFIATKVVAYLQERGFEVSGYDIVEGKDLLNIEQLEPAIIGADVVFHIAAQADLTQMARSISDGRKGVLANVEATHNVAYLCAKYNKWLIYASTVCVYGNQEVHPSSEDGSLPNPSELYACSKYSAEWIVRGYGYNYGMPWTILRFATIYGPGMRPALGMHVFFRQAMKGEPITVHGDGQQDRTLTYIDDLVEGIVAPLDHVETSQGHIFNLSSNLAVSATQMAKDVKQVVKSESEIIYIPQRENQTMHEDFEVGKAFTNLGWEARTLWINGLEKTYEWMKTQRI
jgi:UDP-glucuronate 4-epimerase